jgi:hypothetical protein
MWQPGLKDERTPACNSATNFTRHTSFGTNSPASCEPKIYPSRNKPHRFACSPRDAAAQAHAGTEVCYRAPVQQRLELKQADGLLAHRNRYMDVIGHPCHCDDFRASDAAKWITGEVLNVDGGMTAG